MSLYSIFKTDPKVETEGLLLEYGEARFRIRRAGGSNRKYADILAAKLRPYRRQIENESLDNDVAARIMAEVYAETVIIGWEGVTDEKGKPLPFTKENCVKLFTDLPDLFRDLQEQAGKMANFRAEEITADAKN